MAVIKSSNKWTVKESGIRVGMNTDNINYITLYQNPCENNKVDKTNELVYIDNIIGTFRNVADKMEPIITVERNIIDFNYVYINLFNRYYFVKKVESIHNKLWRLYLKEDVLMSFKDTILNQVALIDRQENDFNPYIVDNLLPLEKQTSIRVEKPVKFEDIFKIHKLQQETSNFVYCVQLSIATSPTTENPPTPIENPEKLNTPQIPSGINDIFLLDYENLFKLHELLFSDGYINTSGIYSNPSEYITRITAYPIDLLHLGISSGYLSQGEITLNGQKTQIRGATQSTTYNDGKAHIRGGSFVGGRVEFATFSTAQLFKNKSFLDYNPYTKLTIFLPFIGFKDIKVDEFKDGLKIYYVFDLYNNKVNVQLYNNNPLGEELILTISGSVGMDISLGATNKNEVERNLTSKSISTIVGTIATGIGSIGALATGNIGLGIGLGASALGISLKGATDIVLNADMSVKHGELIGDWTSYFSAMYPFIIFETYNVGDMTGYNKLIGRPSLKVKKLSTLKGFTRVSNIHLENFNQATYDEVDEIEKQLLTGVLI